MNTLTFMWQAYKLALAALAKKRAAERDADERRAIAKAFNDRYCYRNLYNPKAPRLEGTAKGGIVFAVQEELGVPVKLVGLGEGADDLAPFDPAAFVDALL